ncbi:hypothetical protein Vretifemale_11954, partial [Volvox reticuliferus]
NTVSKHPQQQHPHSHGHGHAEWKDYRHLHPRYRTSVEALRSMAKARTMSDHIGPADHLDIEVSFDSPFIFLQGRDNVRLAEYLTKWAFADVDVKPLMYKAREVDEKRTRLEVMMEVDLAPHRPWWLPATWLLQKCYKLNGVFQLRISKGSAADGSADVITALDGYLLNWGKVPQQLRYLFGTLLSTFNAAFEGVWSNMTWVMGERQVVAEGGSGGVVGKAKAKAAAAVEKVQETVGAVTEKAQGAMGAGVGAQKVQDTVASAVDTAATAAAKTTGAADAAAATVGNGIKGTADAMRGAVQEFAGAVKSGVETGTDKVAQAAFHAKKALAGHS